MRKIYLIFLILFLISFSYLRSQEIVSSSTYIKTCIEKTECSSISNSSFLFYDQSKSALYLKLDFNKFKSGEDSLDYWLDDLTETFLYFKVNFPPENLLGLTNHQHKTFKLNGEIYLNGIWHHQSIEITLFSSENSILSNANTGQNPYENLKLNMSFNIQPKDFKIHKKPHHLKKIMFIGIALGRINILLPEQQNILGEAYNHQ